MNRPRMSSAQHTALTNLTDEGCLTTTDKRVIKPLLRQKWVVEIQVRVGRRRPRPAWRITEAGQLALGADPKIIHPSPRANWRHWEKERWSEDHYVVEGHELVRPARGMLWRVRCLDHAEPVAHHETLVEAVEELAQHLLWNTSCSRVAHSGTSTELDENAATDPLAPPEPILLDHIT